MTAATTTISSEPTTSSINTTAINTYEKQKISKEEQSTEITKEVRKEDLFNPELLGFYYSQLFPYDLMYSWLSYEPHNHSNKNDKIDSSKSSSSLFSKREFSFTIKSPTNDDVYIRYQSFPNAVQLATMVQKRRPIKIDIGAVFSVPPKDKNAFSADKFHTTQREFVIDIDLTDYDNVRHCGCSEANICTKCWVYIPCAMKVLHKTLKDDFGFEHIVWFYSGRRGVHCWVCDTSARLLSNEARGAITSYLELVTENAYNRNAGSIPMPLHPLLQRAFEILEPDFQKFVIGEDGHKVLSSPEACTKLLSTLPEGDARQKITNALSSKWKKDVNITPKEKWEDILTQLSSFQKGKPQPKANKISNTQKQALEAWKYKTVFRYTYPRLDVNVSKMQNHLLKSPFCAHPKTGRVCVPIDIKKAEEFDPFAVPTLAELCEGLMNGDEEASAPMKYWRESLDYFEKEFLVPLRKSLWREEKERKEELAAAIGDF